MQRHRLILLVLAFLLPACSTTTSTPIATATFTVKPSATATDTPSPTPSPTPSLTASATPTASDTPTPSITPTYALLRGQVLPEKLSCRFGPGAVYLYKFGILQNTNIELIARMPLSNWILVRAIGGTNRCWVNSDLVEINGEINALAPADPHVVLAWSPYYGALTGAKAVREGDEVTISWHELVLTAGDDSEQIPYVVETWLCVDGEIVFKAVGSYYTEVTVIDEADCEESSHARVGGAEKHGYTLWSGITWPPHEENK